MQRTIASPGAVSGFGYWSGQDVSVQFRPAEAGHGIVFVRTDLGPQARAPALAANQIDAQRRTVLELGGVRVAMVEHVMATLAGLGIDNCEVCVSAEEMPGLDGSARPFVEAIERAGIVELPAPRRTLRVTQSIRLEEGPAWIEAHPVFESTIPMGVASLGRPVPHEGLSVEYRLDYGQNNPVGRQRIKLEITPESFRRELADARTFMFKYEADWLISRGLGTRVSSRDLLVFDEHGLIDNTLRFEDECVRHKALDVIGDLALAGCDLHARIVAHRSGHRLNAALVRAIQEEAAQRREQDVELSSRALSA